MSDSIFLPGLDRELTEDFYHHSNTSINNATPHVNHSSDNIHNADENRALASSNRELIVSNNDSHSEKSRLPGFFDVFGDICLYAERHLHPPASAAPEEGSEVELQG